MTTEKSTDEMKTKKRRSTLGDEEQQEGRKKRNGTEKGTPCFIDLLASSFRRVDAQCAVAF